MLAGNGQVPVWSHETWRELVGVRPASLGVDATVAGDEIVGAAGPSALAAEAIRRAINDF